MEKNGELLRRLGIWPNLGGYRYLVYGMQLVREQPDRLQRVTKELYPEIGKYYHMSWPSVEHAIRTAVTACWERGNRELLEEMVGYPLKKKPRASEFLAMLAAYGG